MTIRLALIFKFNFFAFTGKDKLESLVVNKANFEAYVRDLLLVRQYRVEVYTGGTKTNNWTLQYKVRSSFRSSGSIDFSKLNFCRFRYFQGSPGNLSQFEDLLFEHNDQIEGSTVIAIRVVADSSNKVQIQLECFISSEKFGVFTILKLRV